MAYVDLHFTSAPGVPRLVRRSISKFGRDEGLTDEQQFSLTLAIGEAVNNVIEHAYRDAPGSLSVRLRRDKRWIYCVVEDRGTWRHAKSEGRGRGLSIMRSLMDGVEVDKARGGTVVKMVYDVRGVHKQ